MHIRERKAGNSTTYPLARSVEIAILEYLRNGRPPSTHRQVFLSVIAPFRPLVTGFALASHIGKYLEQAGIEVETPGTHIFRYSCATVVRGRDAAEDHRRLPGTRGPAIDDAVHQDRHRSVTRSRPG